MKVCGNSSTVVAEAGAAAAGVAAIVVSVLVIAGVFAFALPRIANYGDVWDCADLEIEFDQEKCIGCKNCAAKEACPMKAIVVARWSKSEY